MSRIVKKKYQAVHPISVFTRILVGYIGTAISFFFVYLVQIRNQHLQKPLMTEFQV